MTSLSPARAAVLSAVAERIVGDGATCVGIDGVDGAGKTVFADDLAGVLRADGIPVVRISMDGFHHPRAVRYRRGRSSPEGFWLDSYDYLRFRADVIDPFSPGGGRRYQRAAFDVATDRPVDLAAETAADGAVLIVDGIFLHRDELAEVWDLSVFLHADFEVTFARMAVRDGLPAEPHAGRNRRYLEGQRIYLETCEPERRADLVVDNNDPAAPRIRRRTSGVAPGLH